MLGSVADSTVRQYNTSLKMWWNYCSLQMASPFEKNIPRILTFLQNILEKTNHSYGSFNSHRSAISLIVQEPIGDDPVVKRFMKSIFRQRPPRPKYDITWDPKDVLKYFEESTQASLKFISAKLLTLLALATGQRIQTLSLIKCSNIFENERGIRIIIPDRIKTSGPKKQQPILTLPFFVARPSLCVAKLIQQYSDITKNMRDTLPDVFFRTTRKPHGPASKQSLSRWVKEALEAAGIDTSIFKAHSTRHASTSDAHRKGLSMDVIRKSAGWSDSSNCFAVFYNCPLKDQSTLLETVFTD